MITYSGLEFDPAHPRSNQISLLDIAVGLSRVPRFVGHLIQPYSVAHHSIYVSQLLEQSNCSVEVQLQGLLHDASEAYTGDIPTPVKDLLKPNITELENNIQRAIYTQLRVKIPTEDEKKKIKEVDIQAFHDETLMRNQVQHICYWIDELNKLTSSEIALFFMREFYQLKAKQ